MANAPSSPYDLAQPATHAIEDMAKYKDPVGRSPIHEFLNRSTFPFLRLPVELQINVLDQISYYSDLKALILNSKELSILATPCLYKCLEIKNV